MTLSREVVTSTLIVSQVALMFCALIEQDLLSRSPRWKRRQRLALRYLLLIVLALNGLVLAGVSRW